MLVASTAAALPWANGAGTTRELATGHGTDGRVSWRLSVADLDHDACFSRFPGIDRLFVALGRLSLSVSGEAMAMEAGDMVRFAGEAAVAVQLERPTRALNLMTRRGVFRGAVRLRERTAPDVPGSDLTVDLGDHLADVFLTQEGQR